jgi:hypothetical protein
LDGKCIDNPREITIKASLKILDLCDNTQIKPPDSFNAEDIDDQQESINSNTQGLMDLINK